MKYDFLLPGADQSPNYLGEFMTKGKKERDNNLEFQGIQMVRDPIRLRPRVSDLFTLLSLHSFSRGHIQRS